MTARDESSTPPKGGEPVGSGWVGEKANGFDDTVSAAGERSTRGRPPPVRQRILEPGRVAVGYRLVHTGSGGLIEQWGGSSWTLVREADTTDAYQLLSDVTALARRVGGRLGIGERDAHDALLLSQLLHA